MTDPPIVTVVLYTYEPGDRKTAEITLRSTLDHIHYSGLLTVHIADDGSPQGHRDKLIEIAAGYDKVQSVGVSNTERRGYGASYNRATQATHTAAGILLPLEDDWELVLPLDLDPLVATLDGGDVRSIRLGYIGYTQELRGRFIWTAAGQMLLLDPASPEPHVAAGHPRLETRQYQRDVGPWVEGLAAGATEFDWVHRPVSRVGVAWPMDLVHPRGDLFEHIGAYGLGELEPEGAEVEA